MAEGSGWSYENPTYKPDWGYDDDYEQEVNRTQPFQPGAASTPAANWHSGEQHEMQTRMHEQSGLPSYDETTPLMSASDEEIQRRLDALREDPVTGLFDTTKIPDASVNPLSQEEKEEQIRRVKRLIKSRYPNADVDKLVIRFSTKKPMDVVVLEPKGGETKIVLDDGSGLLKEFLDKTFIKKALGESFEELQRKENEESYGERQRLNQTEKKKKGQMMSLKNKIKLQETERIRNEFISLQEERIRHTDSDELEDEIKKLEEAKKQLKALKDRQKRNKKPQN